MVTEATRAGLVLDRIAFEREMALGGADPLGPIHRSLKGPWWLVEALPRRVYSFAENKRHWRIEVNKPRYIKDGAILHSSVLERMAKLAGYAPPNLRGHDPDDLKKKFVIEG